MKTFLAGLCWLLVFAGVATAQGKTGVYKKVDDALNERVRADMARHFAAGEQGVAALFKQFCVCLPPYWDVIQKRGVAFRHGEPIPPPWGKTGMSTKDAGDMAVLAKQIFADMGPKPAIRKLTDAEIKSLVESLPIEMEEPIFMLENNGMKIVVLMGEDDHTGNYYIVFVGMISG